MANDAEQPIIQPADGAAIKQQLASVVAGIETLSSTASAEIMAGWNNLRAKVAEPLVHFSGTELETQLQDGIKTVTEDVTPYIESMKQADEELKKMKTAVAAAQARLPWVALRFSFVLLDNAAGNVGSPAPEPIHAKMTLKNNGKAIIPGGKERFGQDSGVDKWSGEFEAIPDGHATDFDYPVLHGDLLNAELTIELEKPSSDKYSIHAAETPHQGGKTHKPGETISIKHDKAIFPEEIIIKLLTGTGPVIVEPIPPDDKGKKEGEELIKELQESGKDQSLSWHTKETAETFRDLLALAKVREASVTADKKANYDNAVKLIAQCVDAYDSNDAAKLEAISRIPNHVGWEALQTILDSMYTGHDKKGGS